MIELAGNLIVEDGKILLLYREDHGHWEVPGGKVEENESPTEAAIREAEEEIGVKVTLKKPFYSGEFQHDGKMFLWHCYLSDIESGEPEIVESNKFGELDWFKPSELEELELAPNLEMIEPSLMRL